MTMRDGGRSLRSDRTGQAETIGIVLILAITLMGTGLVVGYGAQALGDTERVTTITKAEHAMTQFDSQAAIVGLGESTVQRVDLGSSGDGGFAADDQAGWIKIVHHNATGDGNDEVLYNASLGAVRYQADDTTVAYQGGGVWRRGGNGSTMLSPPEFNYRGGTLTLPVIRVATEDSAAGETTAIIKQGADSRRVYPNQSANYTGSSKTYSNPITSGTVEVRVKSEFYKGWGDFFRTRTAGNVSVDHTNGTASVELITFDTIGEFRFSDALDDDGLDFRGQSEGHSLTNFKVKIESDSGNAFSNHYVSFYAEEGNHRWEYLVHVPSGVSCNGGIDGDDTLETKVFYRNTETGEQHEWNNTSLPAGSGPTRLECTDDGSTLHIDVTSDQNLAYGNTSSEGTYYDWSGDAAPNAEFNHTDEDGMATSFTSGDSTTSRHLSRHYVAFLGDDFTLNARSGTGGPGQGGGAQIDFGSSGGQIEYDTGGATYITYLHVTENEIEVELE